MTLVAVIEDDPQVRAALERALGAAGYAVTASATGLGGLSTIVDERPDVVILDLGLPDIDGLELLKMLRAVSARCRSSWPRPGTTTTASSRTLDAGADDYVIKPFSTSQLDARIRAVLRRIGRDRGGARACSRSAA